MRITSLQAVRTRVFEAAAGGGGCAFIVLNPSSLTTEQMQSVAALSDAETVFVLDPLQPDADVRLLFFAPKCPMEICVHGLIGAIAALIDQRRLTRSPVQIETALGCISVEWVQGAIGAEVIVEQFPPTFDSNHPSPKRVAAALGTSLSSICLDRGPLQIVSTGRAKLIIPIVDYAALDHLQPDFEGLWALCDRYCITGLYPFTCNTRSPTLRAEARQFPNQVGFNEDPATGVAASGLAAYLAEHEMLQPKGGGWQSYAIGQGYAMGSPSRLVAEAFLEDGAITRTRVRGEARVLAMEYVALPPAAPI